MVVLFTLVSCHQILIGEFDFTVLGEEAQDRDEIRRIASAVIAEIDHNVFDFRVLLDILETVVEEGEVTVRIILFGQGIQVKGRISFVIVLEGVEVDHSGIIDVVQSFITIVFRTYAGEEAVPDKQRNGIR